MSVEKIIEINVQKLTESRLSFESYFILVCLVNSERDLLENYVRTNGKIEKSRFEELIKLDYIRIKNLEDLTFSGIEVTEKAKELIGIQELDHKRFFKELKEIYPRRGGTRSLHTDNARSRKLYKDIVTSEDLHNKILKCVQLYTNELKRSNNLQYMQLLPTFLHQRNYEQYLDDVEKGIKNEVKTNISAI